MSFYLLLPLCCQYVCIFIISVMLWRIAVSIAYTVKHLRTLKHKKQRGTTSYSNASSSLSRWSSAWYIELKAKLEARSIVSKKDTDIAPYDLIPVRDLPLLASVAVATSGDERRDCRLVEDRNREVTIKAVNWKDHTVCSWALAYPDTEDKVHAGAGILHNQLSAGEEGTAHLHSAPPGAPASAASAPWPCMAPNSLTMRSTHSLHRVQLTHTTTKKNNWIQHRNAVEALE